MATPASSTAANVALLRAAHQLLEGGSIFPDPLAVPISWRRVETLREVGGRPEVRLLRLFVAARSRFAEDRLALAVDRGVRQAVVLGAGLDTFGLRNPHAQKGLRVFEADRPATQQWKRGCLAKANLPVPGWLSLAAVDFERQAWIDSLAATGFNPREPAFFTWLGVVPYLSRDAIFATLSSIANIPDAEVVFDYGEPPESYRPERRAGYEAMIARAAAAGEPWLSFFNPAELRFALSRLGFAEIEDLAPTEVAARYGIQRDPEAPGGHVVRARCTTRRR
jgi:methyltransferase (TIGR00027 family)